VCSRGRRVARVAVAYEGRAIVPRQERWLWPSLCSKIRELSRRLWVLKFSINRVGQLKAKIACLFHEEFTSPSFFVVTFRRAFSTRVRAT